MNLPAARHGQRFAPRALIVDPDPQTRELHAAILTRVVPDIDQAQDGREALAKAIAHPPSFVITETRLPFISGYTLCSLLRAEPLTSDAAIVIVTGADELADAGQARSSGADSVLTKPCPPSVLLQAIASGRNRLSDSSDAPPARDTQSPSEHVRRTLVRAHQRFETTTPQLPVPCLRCPTCDQVLQYVRSHIGGVNARQSEQWDYYACPSHCGSFEYRQRTRKLRLVV
jgi:DNA-binding response OmpR family regulator